MNTTTTPTCEFCEEQSTTVIHIIDEGGSIPRRAICDDCLAIAPSKENHEQYVEIRTDDTGKVVRSRTVCECGIVVRDFD